MSDTTEYFSGPWAAGSGDISDVENYDGAPGGVLPALTSFGFDESVAGAYLDDGFPDGGTFGMDAVLTSEDDGETDFIAEIVGPPLPPEGDIGAQSQLGFGPVGTQTEPTSYSWIVSPSDAPSPEPELGYLIDADSEREPSPPPNYTVSGDASVASIAVDSSGATAAGTVTFTGAITTAVLTVDDVTANFKGGSLTLSPTNAPSDDEGGFQNWATVDGQGTLEISGGAKATLMASDDALQVGNGQVLVTGSGSSLTTQGLELGEISAGDDPVTGDTGALRVRDGASATIDAQGDYHLYIGESADDVGEIDAAGVGSTVTINGTIVVGNYGAGGLVIGQGGSIEVMGDVMLAAQDGSTGSIDIEGQGGQLSITGTLTIGGQGMASVTVGDGATLDPPDIILGANAAVGGGAVDPTTQLHTSQVQLLTINGGTVMAGLLTVGEAGRGSVVMTGGSLDVADDTSVGHLSGAEGQMTLTGDSDWSAQSVTVGDAGRGVLSISGGASASASDATIGAQSGGSGLVTIGNDGSWDVDLTVGDAGKGTLAVLGGTVTVSDELIIGAQSGSKGQVSVSGGELDMDGGTITVGQGGSGLLLFQQGASLPGNGDLASPDVVLGETGGSSGTMKVTDGGTSVQIGSIVVGENGSGNLTVTAGATLADSGDADIGDAVLARVQGASVSEGGVWTIGGALTVGTDGLGTLSIASGGQVFGANDVTVGDGAGAGGILTVSGTFSTNGSAQASSLGYGTSLTVGNFGVGTLSVSAGAIVAADQGGEGLIQVGATAGGAGVVTVASAELSGRTLEIGSAGASGRVTVQAGGRVAIAGTTTIAATGHVALSGGTLSSDLVTLGAGGQLTGHGLVSAAVADGGLISASGGLLDITGDLSGGGSVKVSAGATLEIGGSDLLSRIQLTGSGAVLKLAVPGTSGGIAGFAGTDRIDLAEIAGGVSAEMSGSTLEVSNAGGSVIASLALIGSYADASFAVGDDGSGGSVITLAASQPEGGPVVAPPVVAASVPQSVQVTGGVATMLSGLAVNDSNTGSTVTATLSTQTGVLSGGGAIGESLDNGTVLILTGSLSQVNTALSGISYTGEAGGTDDVVLSATDTAGNGDSESFSVSVPDVAPGLTVPSAQTLTAESATAVPGIAISSTLTADAIFTVTLSDATGTLDAVAEGGSAVSGVDSTSLVISGDLADVNADLATLTYLGAPTGVAASTQDSLAVAVNDGSGGTASGTVALTVDQAPDVPAAIALPTAPSVIAGVETAIAGVSISDFDTVGKVFTVTVSVAEGVLSADAEGADAVTGAGSGTLSITGALSDVNSSLASLVDDATAPSFGVTQTDTLTVAVADNIGASSSTDVALQIGTTNGFVWTGLSGGAYSDAGNWQPTGGPPAASDIAEFGAGGYQVTGDGSAGEMDISGAASFTGTLIADGLVSGQPALVIDAGGSGEFTAGASLDTQSTAIIGDTGAGVLTFDAGSSASFGTSLEDGAAVSVVVGFAAAGSGVIEINGASTPISSQSDWIIGDSGSGVMELADGAVVTAGTGDASQDFNSSVLGNLAGSFGALNLDGIGTAFDDSGALIVGDLGIGQLQISNGAEVVSSALAGDASAVVGYQAGSSGNVQIKNTGAIWDSQQNAEIGYDGSGTVDVFNGATFEVDGTALRIGRDVGSTGSLLVSGANATLLAAAATFDVGDAGTGSATIAGGADATVAAVVIGAEAGGSGTLAVIGATLSVSGGVTVNSGLLSIDGTGSVSAAAVIVNSGGMLDDAGTLSVSGTITLDGGTLNVGSNGALAAQVVVTGGSTSDPSALVGQFTLTQAVSLAAGVALAIDPNAVLEEGVTGFALGDTLDFDQTALAGVVDSAAWSDGTLSLFDDDGNTLYSLSLSGDFAGDGFSVTQAGTYAEITAYVPGTPPPSFDWFGGTGSFATAADWSNNGVPGVPGASDAAAFLQGGTLQGSGTLETLSVSSQALFDASLTTGGATIDSGGTLALGNGANLTMGGLLTVGGTGVGELDVDAGSTATNSAFIDVGQRGPGVGLISVTGAGAMLTDTGALEVGESGTGTLVVGNGGSVSAGFAELGHDLGSSGSADIASGGTFTDGSTIVGDLGSGTLEIDAGGSLVQTSFATIGNTAYVSLASVSVAGLWSIGSSLDVGYGSAGALDITAGGTVGVVGFYRLGGGLGGDGVVTVSGTGAVLTAGGGAYIGSAGAASDGGIGSWTIENGASASVSSLDIESASSVLVREGSLTVTGALSGSGALSVVSGSLDIGGAVASAVTVTLDPSVLTVGDVAGFGGALVLANGDVIDVEGADGGSYANGVFTLTESGTTIGTIDAAGYIASDFSFVVGAGGLVISDVQAACYGTGTMIATPSGEVAIEDLRAGDPVLTLLHGAQPVVWIGHQHIRCADSASPETLWPVRVRQGAFGAGLPRRDLVLSPEHAVFVPEFGVLIPIRCLVNGQSIVSERRDRVTYWHLALGGHDVLLAEGLPAESFLPGGDGPFDMMVDLPEMLPCAPLRTQGPDVAAVRARLMRDFHSHLEARALVESAVSSRRCERSERRGLVGCQAPLPHKLLPDDSILLEPSHFAWRSLVGEHIRFPHSHC